MHIEEDNQRVVILEEIPNLMSFVVKDSAGMMAFVVAVDGVDCREAAAVGAAVEVIIVDSDIFHWKMALRQSQIEETVRLKTIQHHDS